MEKLIEDYIKSTVKYDYIKINHYEIDGAICSVSFYTDVSEYYSENMNINIWDFLIYLTNKKL